MSTRFLLTTRRTHIIQKVKIAGGCGTEIHGASGVMLFWHQLGTKREPGLEEDADWNSGLRAW